MRSLTAKLTLAFLLVGLIGAILVAVLVNLNTRSQLDRFLSERDQAVLVQALGTYYAGQNSWDGVRAMLQSTPALDMYSPGIALTDARGVVVLGNRNYHDGQTAPSDALGGATAIQAKGQLAGYLLLPSQADRANEPGPPPPDVAFLNRVTSAAALSAVIAALIALALGVLLARTLTHPLRELTVATQAMARGKLDQQVAVRSRDEIGVLATSFNQMSADLARGSQLRKQMTADLAHDLRTPLSILRGYTEGLQDGRLQGSPTLYTIMHGEVQHLQRLVEDLRVLSLADAGELPLNRRAVDPSALLERTGLAYIDKAEQQGIALRVEPAEALPSIAVDTDRMTQVLNNLVSNALRYTPEGGRITLRARAEERELRTESAERKTPILSPQPAILITVEDTGSGIEADDLPFIFDRFYRADQSRQRVDSNASGLGLAIAKAIVEAHGGTLAVESRPQLGTTFTITLPVAAGQDEGDKQEQRAREMVGV
jgi:two-component system sensor histidine kinase BaeS